MSRRVLVAALVALSLAAAACGADESDVAQPTTTAAEQTTTAGEATTTTAAETPADIVDTALAAGGFTTLATALTQAGLVDTLRGEGPFTVFAPTDDAFAELPAGTLAELLADTEALTAVLTYHVVEGEVLAEDLEEGEVDTVNGAPLEVEIDGDTVRVGGATVTTADIVASNGVIHVIDAVLLPPDVDEPAEQAATVLDVIRQPDLAQLGIALNSAGLADALRGPGPYTVFAPNNEAFAALGTDALNELNRNPGSLQPILTYHVVPQLLLSEDLQTGEVATVNGAPLQVTVEGDTVRVNGATVVTADLQAGNGVVHVIDQVLTPPTA
jgi:transforming growth factor-beta-induced protein